LFWLLHPARPRNDPAAQVSRIFGTVLATRMARLRRRLRPLRRACRPSLSNGYHCPVTVSAPQAAPPPKHTAHATERACRPSLSNGFNCGPVPKASTQTQLGKDQYATEAQAAEHCRPRDVVVWANTSTGVYHYAGTHWYGNTKSGAYMCESDSVDDGLRHAQNEEQPHT